MKILKKTKTTWRIASYTPDATQTGTLYSIESGGVNYKLGVVKVGHGIYNVTEYTTGRLLGTFARKIEPMAVALQRWFDASHPDIKTQLQATIDNAPKLNG